MSDDRIVRERPAPPGARRTAGLVAFLVISIAVLAAVPYYLLSSAGRNEYVLRSFRHAPVGIRTFVRKVTVAGPLHPRVSRSVEAPFSGAVEELHIEPGTVVAHDDLVALLDPSGLVDEFDEAADLLAQAEERVRELEIGRETQVRNYERAVDSLEDRIASAEEELVLKEKLYEIGSISRRELEEAIRAVEDLKRELEDLIEEFELGTDRFELDLASAERRAERSRGTYETLRTSLDSTSITSPISGRVINVEVTPGTEVTPGQSLATIVDMSSALVLLELEESHVQRISRGHEAAVRVGGHLLSGEVTYISPVTSLGSGQSPTVEVHVSLEEVPEDVRAYSTATVDFEIERREDVPYLPRGPYLTSGEYSFVYVLDGERAVRRDVNFGHHDGDFIEVRSGLSVGEEVITSSYEEYKERREVPIVPEGGRAQ